MNGIGGCPNVGGVCIGCTMPGFPDKFIPFMDEPPGARMSTAAVNVYGKTVRSLRQFTLASMNREPPRPARPVEPTDDAPTDEPAKPPR
jgi:hydrogenase small subunit